MARQEGDLPWVQAWQEGPPAQGRKWADISENTELDEMQDGNMQETEHDEEEEEDHIEATEQIDASSLPSLVAANPETSILEEVIQARASRASMTSSCFGNGFSPSARRSAQPSWTSPIPMSSSSQR